MSDYPDYGAGGAPAAHHLTHEIGGSDVVIGWLLLDGSVPLTADWDIGDGHAILADKIKARGSKGLKLYDDDEKGIFVRDGGNIGIGTTTPDNPLEVIPYQVGNIKLGYGIIGNWEYSEANHDFFIGQIDEYGRGITNYAFRSNIHGHTYFNARSSLNFRIRNVCKMFVSFDGDIGIGTETPTTKLDINSDIMRLRTAKTPASAGAAGNRGDLCCDADYLYVCTATNTWKRSVLSTW